MSTDQKRKLLWGNKKNTAAEEVTYVMTHNCFTKDAFGWTPNHKWFECFMQNV